MAPKGSCVEGWVLSAAGFRGRAVGQWWVHGGFDFHDWSKDGYITEGCSWKLLDIRKWSLVGKKRVGGGMPLSSTTCPASFLPVPLCFLLSWGEPPCCNVPFHLGVLRHRDSGTKEPAKHQIPRTMSHNQCSPVFIINKYLITVMQG